MTKTKPVLVFNSVGETGNIFWIIGALYNLVGKTKGREIYNEIQQDAKSYDQALEIISKYVELIDSPNAK